MKVPDPREWSVPQLRDGTIVNEPSPSCEKCNSSTILKKYFKFASDENLGDNIFGHIFYAHCECEHAFYVKMSDDLQSYYDKRAAMSDYEYARRVLEHAQNYEPTDFHKGAKSLYFRFMGLAGVLKDALDREDALVNVRPHD